MLTCLHSLIFELLSSAVISSMSVTLSNELQRNGFWKGGLFFLFLYDNHASRTMVLAIWLLKSGLFFLLLYDNHASSTICLCSRKEDMWQGPGQELSTFLLSAISVDLGASPLLLVDLTTIAHKWSSIQVMMRSFRLRKLHDVTTNNWVMLLTYLTWMPFYVYQWPARFY